MKTKLVKIFFLGLAGAIVLMRELSAKVSNTEEVTALVETKWSEGNAFEETTIVFWLCMLGILLFVIGNSYRNIPTNLSSPNSV